MWRIRRMGVPAFMASLYSILSFGFEFEARFKERIACSGRRIRVCFHFRDSLGFSGLAKGINRLSFLI